MSEKSFTLSTPFSLYNGVVVLESTEKSITFGLLDVTDRALQERLMRAVASFFRDRASTGSCTFVAMSKEEFERTVSLQYGQTGDARDVPRADGTVSGERHAAVLLLQSLLADARTQGATDIHIEEKRVRFRVNGRLKTVCTLAAERSRELVRRIKMLAQLDMLEKRNGQDGQFVAEESLFVRVSVIPVLTQSGQGESVVLRLLDPARVPLDFVRLGFSPSQCAGLEMFSQLENGLVLICGATGAGKSTTAAALLMCIQTGEARNIITVEEPPEYLLPGITQIAVDAQFGMDFSQALRRIFRHDPDVLFIGEVRDEKTAHVAVQAALTGHLVITTVHTSGFYETVLRLTQLGIPAHDLAAVLRGMVVQRLDYTQGTVRLHAEVLRVRRDIAQLLCSPAQAETIQTRLQEEIL